MNKNKEDDIPEDDIPVDDNQSDKDKADKDKAAKDLGEILEKAEKEAKNSRIAAEKEKEEKEEKEKLEAEGRAKEVKDNIKEKLREERFKVIEEEKKKKEEEEKEYKSKLKLKKNVEVKPNKSFVNTLMKIRVQKNIAKNQNEKNPNVGKRYGVTVIKCDDKTVNFLHASNHFINDMKAVSFFKKIIRNQFLKQYSVVKFIVQCLDDSIDRDFRVVGSFSEDRVGKKLRMLQFLRRDFF